MMLPDLEYKDVVSAATQRSSSDSASFTLRCTEILYRRDETVGHIGVRGMGRGAAVTF